ncbi:hypothetical protein PRIPAC_79863 [Pristionchus pacificus]|uniref:Xaa-Pro dipeptidase n=1 Tax=Pristionchus pacificus TaxID=54126 RepID=A0A2A6C423_PRIPA|nr:hypothetical protein PRIPAC_79863 [Pristionchus pacificus]|eukprot:PDM72880.1 Peptidase [Pristionchus pacificus]
MSVDLCDSFRELSYNVKYQAIVFVKCVLYLMGAVGIGYQWRKQASLYFFLRFDCLLLNFRTILLSKGTAISAIIAAHHVIMIISFERLYAASFPAHFEKNSSKKLALFSATTVCFLMSEFPIMLNISMHVTFVRIETFKLVQEFVTVMSFSNAFSLFMFCSDLYLNFIRKPTAVNTSLSITYQRSENRRVILIILPIEIADSLLALATTLLLVFQKELIDTSISMNRIFYLELATSPSMLFSIVFVLIIEWRVARRVRSVVTEDGRDINHFDNLRRIISLTQRVHFLVHDNTKIVFKIYYALNLFVACHYCLAYLFEMIRLRFDCIEVNYHIILLTKVMGLSAVISAHCLVVLISAERIYSAIFPEHFEKQSNKKFTYIISIWLIISNWFYTMSHFRKMQILSMKKKSHCFDYSPDRNNTVSAGICNNFSSDATRQGIMLVIPSVTTTENTVEHFDNLRRVMCLSFFTLVVNFLIWCLHKKFFRMSFDRGGNTLHIKVDLFVKNRKRLVDALRGKVPAKSAILLQGGKEHFRYNTDMDDLPFRQESYFFWTFGVHESEVYGAIDIDTGKTILFPPRLSPDFEIWEGKINPEEWFKDKYAVDEVHFNEDTKIYDILKANGAAKLYLLKAENSDSGNTLLPPNFIGIEKFPLDEYLLYPIMAELRVFKTDDEIEVLRYASKIASDAHKAAMKHIIPGMYEYQLESLFRHTSYYHGGCRHLSYTCVAASGCDSAVIHYGHANAPNDRKIEDGDICLFDMGPEYNCYASDVTTSFPANGIFTDRQKLIYNAVLDANRTVFEAAKPGVRWTAMHELAEKIILTHLKEGGLVVGDVDEMVKARLGAVFMPHGLGHLIGLDVHDVGGFLGDALPKPTVPGLKNIRTTRTLQERMCISIEPGCYFIDTLLDPALADPILSKFLVAAKVNEFRGFGGVRIEDDVIIWAKGNENMSQVPRTVEEIESFMTSI